MRTFPLIVVAATTLVVTSVLASEIREFDVKTLQRLGNELARVSQTRDRGATTPERKRARETAIAALRGDVLNIHYEYVVLDDPAGGGFLVYALGSTRKSGQFVLGGHIRVTVSADGRTVKRIDPLSRTLLIEDEKNTGLPKGTHLVGTYYNQIVSTKPVETLIYISNVSKRPIFVGTPDGKMWKVANGTMSIDRSKPGSDPMGGAARKAFQQHGR
jgi:hypothetical protein